MLTGKAPNTSSPERPAGPHDPVRLAACGAVFCWALWLSQAPGYDYHEPPAREAAALASKINANADPWWKLAALPNIGMVKAKRIVAFRKQSPSPSPFKSALDLQEVHGIGPKTVERIAPMLCFDVQEQPGPADAVTRLETHNAQTSAAER